MLTYCRKCALIINNKQEESKCKACDIPMEAVPKEYLTSSGLMFLSQDARKEFENMIKNNEEFDNDANLNRDAVIASKEAEHKAEVEKKVAEYNQTRFKRQCPVCHSEQISKISNVGKFVKVSAFGILGAGDIGKQYKFNSCGYRY